MRGTHLLEVAELLMTGGCLVFIIVLFVYSILATFFERDHGYENDAPLDDRESDFALNARRKAGVDRFSEPEEDDQ